MISKSNMGDDVAARNFLALKSKSFDIKFDLNDTNYTAIENIGTGAYGVVCSAKHTLTKEEVAIKKIPDIFVQPTIAKRTYREIKILKHFKHDNIIAIREILKPKGEIENLQDVYIVLDLMETDMHRIIHSKQELTEEHVRYFLYQILRGLKYIHSANVIHRDLKPSNLLVNANCELKIGDFGMARGVSSDPDDENHLMTQYVATRWYRAPELMLAKLAYTGAVDMWSVGCIFAEMLGRKQIFPGNDYIDQLKKIMEVLGTPTKEFIQLTHSETIQNFVLKISGCIQQKPIPLSERYPKASSKAIDLLKCMLCMNPSSRTSVAQALKHPFLTKYHDPVDEPICVPVFDFSFEEKDMPGDELKTVIIKEIMDYHPVREKPKIAFNFRPVPKSEMQSSSKSPQKTSPVKSDNFICGDKDANFGLNAFLNQIRGGNKENNSKSLKSGDVKSEYTTTGQPLSFLSTNSPTSQSAFKVPMGLPISKQKMDKNHLQIKAETQSEDIEMLSAKSGLSIQTETGASSDVEMLSANKLKPSTTGNQSVDEPVKQEAAPEKSVNAKEVLKAAILSAALRKQKGGQEPKSRPITALQRQREREEKKKKKMEKAMERKKKQKQKEKSSGITLSDDDKNLLARWTNMQSRPVTPAVTSASGKSLASSVFLESRTPSTTLFTNSTFTEHSKHYVASNAAQLPNLGQSNKFDDSNKSDKNTIASVDPNLDVNKAIYAGSVNINSGTTHLIQTNPLSVVSTVQGSMPSINTVSTTNNKLPDVEILEFTPTDNLVGNPPDSVRMTQQTVPNVSQPYTYTVTSEIDNDSPLTNPLDSILDELEKDSEVDNKRPPSYNEAVQAKLQALSPPHGNDRTSPLMPADSSQSFLPFQTYQPEQNSDSIPTMYPRDVNLSNSSAAVDANQKEPNLLSVITRQLCKSHMDDLTLTKTPKGTGGTGYGVGYDLESLMAGTEIPDRSAPISATESLLGDWQEVGINAKEFEAIEKELGIGPGVGFGDMVTSPS